MDAQLIDAGVKSATVGGDGGLDARLDCSGICAAVDGGFTTRWWQAALYNQAVSEKEFHQLRLPRFLALIALLVLAVTWFVPEVGTGSTMLLLTGWLLQGLARYTRCSDD